MYLKVVHIMGGSGIKFFRLTTLDTAHTRMFRSAPGIPPDSTTQRRLTCDMHLQLCPLYTHSLTYLTTRSIEHRRPIRSVCNCLPDTLLPQTKCRQRAAFPILHGRNRNITQHTVRSAGRLVTDHSARTRSPRSKPQWRCTFTSASISSSVDGNCGNEIL